MQNPSALSWTISDIQRSNLVQTTAKLFNIDLHLSTTLQPQFKPHRTIMEVLQNRLGRINNMPIIELF